MIGEKNGNGNDLKIDAQKYIYNLNRKALSLQKF